MNTAPSIQVHRFYKAYKPDPKDPAKMIEVDMIDYGPPLMKDKSVITATVSSLRKLAPLVDGGNPAIALAHLRWEVIAPKYEKWKAGEEMPVEGTPLAAWNRLAPEQAELFKKHDVRSVEQIAQMTDAHIERFPIPNIRAVIEDAKRFLASADTVRFAKELEDKDKKIDEQSEQIAALLERVNALAEMVVKTSPADEPDDAVVTHIDAPPHAASAA